ncbi:sugar phosphate isomerase/epimerase [bacterium]|nr:sugar phosphate isomerase/epimerase [bacterium]
MNILSCNIGSYGKYRDGAYEHLVKIGVKHVEIGAPAVADAEKVREELARYGLSATTVSAGCDVADENVAKNFAPAVESAEIMGAKAIFTSVHAGELDRAIVYDRLRQVGDVAAKKGIKVGMETHPDLIHNGDIALETMKGVNHPNICVNFDTGNTYFYNEGKTAHGEVAKIAEHVASVHLKDTNGKLRSWCFPTFGTGVVDFAEVFQILNGIGFHGPFTMEIEGCHGENLTKEETELRVAESVEHLRKIGCID